MINPLIAVRDIHFASSLLVAGIVFFDLFVASPTLRTTVSRLDATAAAFTRRTAGLLWISLALSVVSGFAWLCLLAARIAGKPVAEVIADAHSSGLVLSRTQFGFAWELRFLFVLVLATCLRALRARAARAPVWQEVLVALLAGAYLGALAFAGHGEEGLGVERYFHLAADFFHLIAAGLWLGGLIPLALLLAYLSHFREETWMPIACDAGRRFSDLGIVAVGTLLVSGTINAWFLIGGMQNVIATNYGQLLLLKITLFAAMVGLAGINRQYVFAATAVRLFSNRSRLLVRSNGYLCVVRWSKLSSGSE